MTGGGATSSGPALSLRAILVGLTVDMGASLVAGIALLAVFGVDLADPAALERLSQSTSYLLAALPPGLFCSALGGYVAATLAPGSEMNNAFAVGIASAIAGVLLSLTAPPPLWYLVVSAVLVVPAAMAGGYVRARTARTDDGLT